MKSMTKIVCCLLFLMAAPQGALAHFQALIPNTDIVADPGQSALHFDIRFTHPMEWGPVMNMGTPQAFGLMIRDQKKDLTATLQKRDLEGKTAYTCDYTVEQPGDHIFYIAPAPYWEPAEAKMIIHYTKVVVDGYGAADGWDKMVGLPVEIEPLVRPYGLWTGNIFRGIVRKNGQPVPFAEVEVEYYNVDRATAAPADPYVTQVIKTDSEGVFTYAMPKAGWWSFAALVDGDEKMPGPDGKMEDVELGGLIWVQTRDMK